MFRYIVLIALAFVSIKTQAGVPLVVNGKSEFSICIGERSLPNINKAADTLQFYIHKITGCTLPITHKETNHKILLNSGTLISVSPGTERYSQNSFTIRSDKNNVYIIAFDDIGMEHAIYYFLEKYIGCTYYAHDCVYIPHLLNISLPDIDDAQGPSFGYRTTLYGEANNDAYRRWNLLDDNKRARSKGNEKGNDWGLFVHTLHTLLPPDIYFKQYPEYYALRNNIRVPDQLCLSNPDVLKHVIESLKTEIAKNPDAKYWSVSQMDNYNYCQCDKCRAIDSIEHSHSGAILRFVNQVAAAFPDKVISTLAYQYTRKPPVVTKPLPNVNIMLCTIECDRSKPIASDTSADGFYSDLKGWSALTHNIIVWDYVINFSNIVMPFPNFRVLQPNIQLFTKFGVSMLFEQAWGSEGGELEAMRCYILSKLMWNDKANVDTLMKDFATHYYGRAGNILCDYVNLQSTLLGDHPLTIYEGAYAGMDNYLSPDAIIKYLKLFDKAEKLVQDDPVALAHVKEAKQGVLYAWLEVSKVDVFQPFWCFIKNDAGKYHVNADAPLILDTFYKRTLIYGPHRLNEHGNEPDVYYKKMKDYYANGVISDLAINKPIALEVPYDKQYPANGYGSLTDGVLGTEDYHILWQGWSGNDLIMKIDLQDTSSLKTFSIKCLDDSHSWILFPAKITFDISTDGITYQPAATIVNNEAGKKIEATPKVFTTTLSAPVKARYVRVHAYNIGDMPQWSGVQGKAWLFVSEVMVQ